MIYYVFTYVFNYLMLTLQSTLWITIEKNIDFSQITGRLSFFHEMFMIEYQQKVQEGEEKKDEEVAGFKNQ